jgi:PAS domain-containing protein
MIQHIRVSDRSHEINLAESGFIKRSRTPLQQVGRLFALVVIIVLGVSVLVYNNTLIGAVLCTGVGTATLLIARKLDEARKAQLATEFMSALFASALSKDYALCTIVRLDGEILYLNQSFQKLFPRFISQPDYGLKSLLTLYSAAPDAVDSLLVSIAANRPKTQSVKLELEEGARTFDFVVEPIGRPKGYVLLRGK